MEDSIFTKIIKGEIPCHKVYEDEKTFAFMDINPIQPGHILVVSKKPYVSILDMEDEDYVALFRTVKRVAKKLKQILPDKKRIGVMVEGLDVDHVHVKVFPIDTGEEFRRIPDMDSEPNHEALAKLAKKLSF